MTNLVVPLIKSEAEASEVCELLITANSQSTVGLRLREQRESRGWSLSQVARHLNMTVSYIEALETDNFSRLPSATFVRGYLRNYARCLEMPAEELIAAYEQQLKTATEPIKLRKREKLKSASSDPLMRVLGVLSVALFVFFSLFWWGGQSSLILPGNDAVAIVEVDTISGETIVKKLDMNISQAELTNSAADAPQTDSLPVSTAESVLVVNFTDHSWLKVQDASGTLLFSGVKEAGEVLQLTSLSALDIVIGNAAAVKLSYNGAPVDLALHANGENAASLQLGL